MTQAYAAAIEKHFAAFVADASSAKRGERFLDGLDRINNAFDFALEYGPK
jgi:hypothetical protein